MPSPRDQPTSGRNRRRQETMPGGWLWVVILLLISVVLLMAFGFNANGSIEYSEFEQLAKNGRIVKVTLPEASNTLVAEVKDLDNEPEAIRKQASKSGKLDVLLWRGDIDSGEVSKMLDKYNIPRKTERDWKGMVAPTLSFLLIVFIFGAFFVIFFLPRFRDPLGSNFLNNYIRSPAKRFDKTKAKTTFEDVADMTNAKFELQEIVDFLKSPEKFVKLGAQIPKGVLLVGPPGTGKTLLARAVAGEAGVPFFSISGSEFIQMFVGVGASRVRDMFKTAKDNAPCLLFIDEIDAVGRMRGAGVGGGSDEREQTLNQILSEMDGFQPNEAIIVIAATNRPDVLDSALLRPGRFDRHVVVDRPTWQGRLDILKVHTRTKPLADDVNLEEIARKVIGMTGADLRNLANEAALIACRENKSRIGRVDFENAADRVLMGAKRDEVLTADTKKQIAYHEGGHALVAWLQTEVEPPQKVTIVPRGRAGGVTFFGVDEDRMHYGLSYFKAELTCMMGGRAAERLAYGQIFAGAESDLKQATKRARYMVTHWGMSERLGPMSFRIGEEHVFLGKEIQEPRDFSETTANVIDEEVQKLLFEADAGAYQLLETHRKELDQIVDLLMQKEEIFREDLEVILGKRRSSAGTETGIKVVSEGTNSKPVETK